MNNNASLHLVSNDDLGPIDEITIWAREAADALEVLAAQPDAGDRRARAAAIVLEFAAFATAKIAEL